MEIAFICTIPGCVSLEDTGCDEYLVNPDFDGPGSAAGFRIDKDDDGDQYAVIETAWSGFEYKIWSRGDQEFGVKYDGAENGFLRQDLIPPMTDVQILGVRGTYGEYQGENALGNYSHVKHTWEAFVSWSLTGRNDVQNDPRRSKVADVRLVSAKLWSLAPEGFADQVIADPRGTLALERAGCQIDNPGGDAHELCIAKRLNPSQDVQSVWVVHSVTFGNCNCLSFEDEATPEVQAELDALRKQGVECVIAPYTRTISGSYHNLHRVSHPVVQIYYH